GRFEAAATKFREAGKLGCRDRRLGQMLNLSLFHGGRQQLYGSRAADAEKLLDQATKPSSADPNAVYLLALACKRQGKTADARAAFRKINRPDANVFFQLGLLALEENQPGQAEQD